MPKNNIRRKAQLGLDIREGGIAIPIANNMFYIKGRKHSAGGVAIGPNNKNGVEVEDKEVVQLIDSNHLSIGRQFKAGGQQQTMRVFSSVPLLQGVSPAELVLQGYNPDDVFKAQEEFKDRNHINDDGTHYEMGGSNKAKSKNKISRPVTGILPYGYSIRNLYAVENPYRKGIKGNTARMYDSRTLGAGVDVVSGHPELYKKAKAGRITKKQADETAVIHLRKDDNAIRSNYADVYGKAAADTLSYGPRFLVAQARYQQGNVRKAWPAIHKAMAKGNAKALKKAVLQVTPKDHTYRRKWIEGFKVYKYGGNMIYEINGNVKNSLMSARPKAQYGKEKKINEDTKIGDDGLIYKRDARGEWWTDGTTYQNSKYYMREQSVQRGGKRSTGEVIKPKVQTQSLPEVVVTAKAPKSEGISLSNLEEDYMIGKRRSANRHPIPKFVGEVNKGKKVVNVKTNSEPRKGITKVATSNTTPKSQPTLQNTVNQITRDAIYRSNAPKIDLTKVKIPTFDVSQLGSKETKAAKAKLNTPSTGGRKQSNSDGRWIPQFNPITTRDWIGLGSNLAGHIASYFTNNALLSKYPMPTKPVMTQAAKLKTTYNINPELTNNREVELTNRNIVRRNTQSSNTSVAREQRIMNEARNARNQLYGRKENIETQLINQDRLNRQSVYQRNVAAYNDWLDKTFVAKNNKLMSKQQNIMNLISGIPMAVNNIIGNIESRQATNNTIKAIAAANPNVDGRLLGIGDYYTQRLGDGRVAIYDKNDKLKKYI